MDASDVQSGGGGAGTGGSATDKRKSTHWVLALQLYHAIKIDEAAGANPSSAVTASSAATASSSASSSSSAATASASPSILDELREIGEDKGGPMCGSAPPESPGSSWVIPARGTPEYTDVMYIMRCLKDNARFEDDAREFIRLRASNRKLLRLNNVDI